MRSGAPGTENLPTYNKGVLTQPVTKGSAISGFLQSNKNDNPLFKDYSKNFNATEYNPVFSSKQQLDFDLAKAKLKKKNN